MCEEIFAFHCRGRVKTASSHFSLEGIPGKVRRQIKLIASLPQVYSRKR